MSGALPNKEAGVASSIIVTMRNLGMMGAILLAGFLLYTTVSPEVLDITDYIIF